jgi:hypothetical protein
MLLLLALPAPQVSSHSPWIALVAAAIVVVLMLTARKR